MGKFYCNICEEEVTLKDGKCPNCKTDWKKVMNGDENAEDNNIEYYQEDEDENTVVVPEITDKDIDDNINFFLSWGNVGKVFLFFVAGVLVLVSFIEMENTDGWSLILLLVAVAVAFFAIVFENSLKWKAYMLHTNKKKKKN